MQLLIYGPGRLGRAIASAAEAAGWPDPRLLGRPALDGRREPAPRADVVVDASSGARVTVVATVGAVDETGGRIDLTVSVDGQTVLGKAQVRVTAL